MQSWQHLGLWHLFVYLFIYLCGRRSFKTCLIIIMQSEQTELAVLKYHVISLRAIWSDVLRFSFVEVRVSLWSQVHSYHNWRHKMNIPFFVVFESTFPGNYSVLWTSLTEHVCGCYIRVYGTYTTVSEGHVWFGNIDDPRLVVLLFRHFAQDVSLP